MWIEHLVLLISVGGEVGQPLRFILRSVSSMLVDRKEASGNWDVSNQKGEMVMTDKRESERRLI